MRLAVAIVASLGCGRIGFDPIDPIANRCSFRTADIGNGFTCALDDEGGVWCWGDDLLSGGTVLVEQPRRIELPTRAVELGTGSRHACARLDDGSVWCWGNNNRGQLKLPSGDTNLPPVEIAIGDSAVELRVGAWHSCVRRSADLAIVCWGHNLYLRLGNTGMLTQGPTPIAGTEGSRQLSLGHQHACAVDAQERVICWGGNLWGQLGDGGSTERAMPMVVPTALPIQRVVAAGRTTCALDSAGAWSCWGFNGAGQFGDGTKVSQTMPASVPLSDIVDLAITGRDACALRGNGDVACWSDPVLQPGAPILSGATELHKDYGVQCATTSEGPQCWGANGNGELGRGTRSVSGIPTQIAMPSADILGIGARVGCARTIDGLYCWGCNLGNGTTGCSLSALPVSTFAVEGITFNLGAGEHACVWGAGNAACWGVNYAGQLGTGGGDSLTPATPVGLTNVTSMAAGAGFTCAIASGRVNCWGRNEAGQLGDGTTMGSPTAVATSVMTATDLSAGITHACAVSGGTVFCWGENGRGQIGVGTTMSPITTPTALAIANVVDVQLGADHSCARTSVGDVYCWGFNTYGQVGTAAYPTQTAPARVDVPEPVTAMAAGISTTCALGASSTVYCWGVNGSGEYGGNDFVSSRTPVEVVGLTGATALAQGNGGGCVIRGGQVLCFGEPIIRGVDNSAAGQPAPITLSCTP